MACYKTYGRSSYFRVKDDKKFEEELKSMGVEFSLEISGEYPNSIAIAFLSQDQDFTYVKDPLTGESIEVDWVGIFSRHLLENQAVIIQEIGHEKLCYITGASVVYFWDGRVPISISLEDVYYELRKLPEEIQITRCEY